MLTPIHRCLMDTTAIQASMTSPATQLVALSSDDVGFFAVGAGQPEERINWVTSMPKPEYDRSIRCPLSFRFPDQVNKLLFWYR